MDLIRIIYTPDGGSKQSWEFDLDNPPWDITFNTERTTGWPWGEFSQKLGQSSAIALRALIWTLRKRNEPRLPLESVEVTIGEFDFERVETEPVDKPPVPVDAVAPADAVPGDEAGGESGEA